MIRSRTCSSAWSNRVRKAPSVARSGGNLVFGQPAAVDVTEQVVLGTGICIDMAQVDARADGRIRHPAILPSPARRSPAAPTATGGGVPSRPCLRASRPSQRPKTICRRAGRRGQRRRTRSRRRRSSLRTASPRRSRRAVGRRDRARRDHLVRPPRRVGRTHLPEPRHADRRRLDGRADQHEQRQRRRQPAAAA